MQSVRGKADGPRDWVANMNRDTKVRSEGHESMNVHQGASSTKKRDRRFRACRESSMWAHLYGKQLIDHLLKRSRRIMRVRISTCSPVRCPMGDHFSPRRLWACYIHSNPIMMQTSISRVEDIRLSRYLTTTRPFHLHHELSMPWLVRQRAEAELAHADPLSLIAELALVWASTEPSHVFGQQHASCSVRHSRVVHLLHRYAISG